MERPEPYPTKTNNKINIMKKRNLHQKLILYGILISFIWLPHKNYAQSISRQCISSYGYVSSSTSVAINQTAGQCFSTSSKSESGNTVLQGFQQPVVFSIEDKNDPLFNQLEVNIYPNPATYNVNITSQEKIENLHIDVMDIAGKIIQSEQILDANFHSISCESWSNGIYFISLKDNNQKSKTIKLIISK